MHRIVFIITYMGKYPWYFPYFLHSCRYNPTIDFLIFTDNNDLNIDLPANVKIIPNSLEQFKADAAQALGFDVAVQSGYKLCDFKPAYGYIFADYIKDYDFWGYCDVDVIFGNIRTFMTDEMLDEYESLSEKYMNQRISNHVALIEYKQKAGKKYILIFNLLLALCYL